MSEWIRGNGRPPEIAVPVLIVNPSVTAYAGEGVWIDIGCPRLTYTPTHWMPLPKPPKED